MTYMNVKSEHKNGQELGPIYLLAVPITACSRAVNLANVCVMINIVAHTPPCAAAEVRPQRRQGLPIKAQGVVLGASAIYVLKAKLSRNAF